MNWIGIIFTVLFCGLMILLTYAGLVMASRADDQEEYERMELNMNNVYREQLIRIKNHIIDKTFLSDDLTAETKIELQIIESMIDEVLDYSDEE